MSEWVVDDFLARTSACSLPIIPAWEFNLKKWMGDGDLADCFSNGLKDISLDVVAMEIRV